MIIDVPIRKVILYILDIAILLLLSLGNANKLKAFFNNISNKIILCKYNI